MQKTKKVPQRKCIACQERDSKKGLIRIVKNKEGQIFLDPIGKATVEVHIYVKMQNA